VETPLQGSRRALSAREEEENVTLLRVEGDEPGGTFFVFNLQMVSRVSCRGFEGGQEGHQATFHFSDGGDVVLTGEDADRALSALEDFAGYPRMGSP